MKLFLRVRRPFNLSMSIAVMLSVLLFSNRVMAVQDLQYDPDEQRNAAMLDQLTAAAKDCMHNGTVTALAQGVRDSQVIVARTAPICGSVLMNYLTKKGHMTPNQAATYVMGLANDALNTVPGLKSVKPQAQSTVTPPSAAAPSSASSKPSTAPRAKLTWGQTVRLTGLVSVGHYMDCCNQGKETRLPYLALHLTNGVDISDTVPDGDPAVQDIRDIELLQLGKQDQAQMKPGQEVTIICEDLTYGATGHYALPTACSSTKLVPK